MTSDITHSIVGAGLHKDIQRSLSTPNTQVGEKEDGVVSHIEQGTMNDEKTEEDNHVDSAVTEEQEQCQLSAFVNVGSQMNQIKQNIAAYQGNTPVEEKHDQFVTSNGQVIVTNHTTTLVDHPEAGMVFLHASSALEEQAQLILMAHQSGDIQQDELIKQMHLRGVTNSEKPFECDYGGGCGRTFASSTHLRYHTRTHTGEKPYDCSYDGCGRSFTSSGHLKYHMTTHTGERPFKCTYPGCERLFAWPAHLKYHKRTHSGERPYKCLVDGCGKSFYVLQRLNVHMRIHTGERPYTCSIENCNKSFTTAGNLKNHQRTHTGERPYMCSFNGCERRFAEHSSLRKHALTHTGEKPYSCDVCGKVFSQSGSRNAHLRRHEIQRTDLQGAESRLPQTNSETQTEFGQIIIQEQEMQLADVEGIDSDQEQEITSQGVILPQVVTEQIITTSPTTAAAGEPFSQRVAAEVSIAQTTGSILTHGLISESCPSGSENVMVVEAVMHQPSVLEPTMDTSSLVTAVPLPQVVCETTTLPQSHLNDSISSLSSHSVPTAMAHAHAQPCTGMLTVAQVENMLNPTSKSLPTAGKERDIHEHEEDEGITLELPGGMDDQGHFVGLQNSIVLHTGGSSGIIQSSPSKDNYILQAPESSHSVTIETELEDSN